MICLPDKFHVSRRFPRTVYFEIDFGAYVDDIFFHKLVSESYKPYLHFLSFFLFFFFFFFFYSLYLEFLFTVYKGVKALFSRDKVLKNGSKNRQASGKALS